MFRNLQYGAFYFYSFSGEIYAVFKYVTLLNVFIVSEVEINGWLLSPLYPYKTIRNG